MLTILRITKMVGLHVFLHRAVIKFSPTVLALVMPSTYIGSTLEAEAGGQTVQVGLGSKHLYLLSPCHLEIFRHKVTEPNLYKH